MIYFVLIICIFLVRSKKIKREENKEKKKRETKKDLEKKKGLEVVCLQS